MKIEKVTIDNKECKIFTDVILFPNTNKQKSINVAEEKLEKCMQKAIAENRFPSVAHIDNMYAYYVPQDIADTENEDEIRQSIEDIYE